MAVVAAMPAASAIVAGTYLFCRERGARCDILSDERVAYNRADTPILAADEAAVRDARRTPDTAGGVEASGRRWLSKVILELIRDNAYG